MALKNIDFFVVFCVIFKIKVTGTMLITDLRAILVITECKPCILQMRKQAPRDSTHHSRIISKLVAELTLKLKFLDSGMIAF